MPSGFRGAFTLIEILAVLAIVALLTAGVSLSLKGTLRDAQARDVVDRLVAFDRSARESARRFSRACELQIDPREGRVRRREVTPAGGGAAEVSLLLPRGVVIEGVATGGGRDRTGRGVSLVCSARGQTASYAVLLRGPADRRHWVMFAGLSGQSSVIESDRGVEEIVALLSER